MKIKTVISSGNIFKDLGFSPEEVEKLNIKSKLMLQIRISIEKSNLTHDEVAELMGIKLVQVDIAVAGKIDKFDIH